MVINLWVVRVSGDASVLGVVSAISAIGLLIGNPIGGYLSDKLNKKALLIISDSFSAIAVLFLYLIYQENSINYIALTMCNFLISFCFAIYSPTSRAIAPLLVSKEKISSLNSKLSVSTEIIKVISPSLGALLMSVGYFNEKDLMLTNLISFSLSLICSILLKPISDSFKNPSSESNTYLEAWRKMGDLKYIVLIFSIFHLFFGGINVVLPFVGIVGEQNYYGYLLGTEAFGAVLAGLTYRRASAYLQRIDERNIFFSCGVFILLTSPHFGIYLNLLTIMFYGYFFTLYSIFFLTTMQLKSEQGYIGRFFGILYTCISIFLPLGSLLFGFVEKVFSNYGMSIIGLMMLLSAVVLLIFKKK